MDLYFRFISGVLGILLHCITIYPRPVNLIKDIEKWMRNFIWSGHVNKRKLVTVAWHKNCVPVKEGGLGTRSLSKINEGANLKLCWEMIHSNLPWAHFLKNRVMKNKQPVKFHISSSIWSGIKHKYSEVILNFSWLVGNGTNINFWIDNWCGAPLVSSLNIPPDVQPLLKSTVSNFINDFTWNLPSSLTQIFPNLQLLIDKVCIPVVDKR